ncbi:unnamed protein product [Paramecium primaurelia]|uniref:Uncharacterized protein n=1 Tax=Paramecium primaurelia TaxID=5886 RepID=A0A8S1PSP1_PARPR|nr:unnamed protein product [Paramecium primaurelia]
MDLAAMYGYLQELAIIILPITTIITMITLMIQIYTIFKIKSLQGQKLIKEQDLNSPNCFHVALEIQQQDENTPLLQKKYINEGQQENPIQQNQNQNQNQEKLQNNKQAQQDQQENQKNQKNEFDNKLEGIKKQCKCFPIIEKIEDIKILVQNYETKYEEDLQKFEQNFEYLYVNSQENQQKVREIIIKLYENTSQKRQVEGEFKYYVRQIQDKQGLRKNYNLDLQNSSLLDKHCNAFREVRGDGNCFYTAFGYQFLQILLFHYSFDQFLQFIEKIKQIDLSMKIFVEEIDFKIDDKETEKLLLQDFLQRLIKLKKTKDINQRQQNFFKQYSTYQYESDEIDSCLYGLSTIFFRNYSDYIIENSEIKEAINDKQNLLLWEQECNNNEAVIAELARNLNIFVELIFFQNKEFNIRQYGNRENQKIILLIKPGHYNIGLQQKETQINQLIQKNVKIHEELMDVDNYEQQIEESTSLQKIIRNLQDQFLKGKLPEIEVQQLKEGLKLK